MVLDILYRCRATILEFHAEHYVEVSRLGITQSHRSTSQCFAMKWPISCSALSSSKIPSTQHVGGSAEDEFIFLHHIPGEFIYAFLGMRDED